MRWIPPNPNFVETSGTNPSRIKGCCCMRSFWVHSVDSEERLNLRKGNGWESSDKDSNHLDEDDDEEDDDDDEEREEVFEASNFDRLLFSFFSSSLHYLYWLFKGRFLFLPDLSLLFFFFSFCLPMLASFQKQWQN